MLELTHYNRTIVHPLPMQKLLFTLIISAFLVGCGEQVLRPPADKPAQAQQAYDSGNYDLAISLYNQLASERLPPESYSYQVHAAQAMFKAGLGRQASQLLNELPPESLHPALKFERQLLLAEIALKRSPEQSLELLKTPAVPESQLPKRMDLYARYHLIRGRANSRLGNQLETGREYILRDLYLSDQDEIEANQLAIWQSLSIISPEKLGQFRLQPPPDALSGWLELVMISKNYNLAPAEVERRLTAWYLRYPDHPAGDQVKGRLLERSKELATRPANIALLLPLSGRFAAAGESVLDGIMAAYYQDPQRDNIHIRVYDIGEQPQQVMQSYWQAQAEGAEFVIGPLDKSAVELLAQQDSLPIPTMALNSAATPVMDNFYQFSLAPEDEAREVAERAWSEGHTQAAIFVPDTSLGERLSSAFSQRWQELGGRIVSQDKYIPTNYDFSDPIKKLLNIDDSEFRKQRIRQLLRQGVEYTPRRRKDIDFVFLAAFPQQARLIRPQLKFFHAGDVPILATSHIYSGEVNTHTDRDINDIYFCDMPWTLDAPSPQQQLRQSSELKRHGGQLQRLVALGIDAYQLVPLVPMLEAYNYERYRGETGNLQIDKRHHVIRQLLWAQFENGQPKLMEERVMDDTQSGTPKQN